MVFLWALGLLGGIAWVQMQAALTPASTFLLPCVGLASIALILAVLARRCAWLHAGMFALVSKSLFNMSVLLAAGLAAAGYASFKAQHALDQRLPDHWDRQSLRLEVVVMDLPTRDLRSWRFEVAVRSALRTDGSNQTVSGFPKRGVVHWYFEEGTLPSDGSSLAEGSQSPAQSSTPNAISPGEIWSLQARVRLVLQRSTHLAGPNQAG